MIDIYLQETEAPWPDAAVAERILAGLEANPFATLERADLNDSGEWAPFDRAETLRVLQRTKGIAYLRPGPSSRFFASISRSAAQNTLAIQVDEALWRTVGAGPSLEYVRGLGARLPNLSRGSVGVHYRVADFYDAHGLEDLPDCFSGFLAWFHLITPRGYRPWFKREDLLQTPAHRVEEREGGIIEITTFEDPLSYDSEESRDRIIEATTYLNERRLDRRVSGS